MLNITKYTSDSALLVSIYPTPTMVKGIITRNIGVISVADYTPVCKLEVTGKGVKLSTAQREFDTDTFLNRYPEEILAKLPKGITISLNGYLRVIGIRHFESTSYANFFKYLALVPFNSAPVEKVGSDQTKTILKHLLRLPDARWNSGRIGILPETGDMVHLNGTFIASMVFSLLKEEYRERLKKVPREHFETVLYLGILKSLPSLAHLIIGTPRFTPSTYDKNIDQWLK